jgi:hypothetical protein
VYIRATVRGVSPCLLREIVANTANVIIGANI